MPKAKEEGKGTPKAELGLFHLCTNAQAQHSAWYAKATERNAERSVQLHQDDSPETLMHVKAHSS